MTAERYSEALRLIDAANAADPNQIETDEGVRPAALVYGQRMSAVLEDFRPDADELLRIAVRAQHIERWRTPRASYPEGRAGYLKWRTDLKALHASRAGELMAEAGYSGDEIKRTGALLRKERLKRDDGAQALEDIACLVFLKFYAAEFIADHEDEKVVDILAKTARKMSHEGLEAAAKIQLSERLGRLLSVALFSPEHLHLR